ncbi:MAG: hypothetical protein QXH32_09840, partial [Candidatus Caldarchaeum sp.]
MKHARTIQTIALITAGIIIGMLLSASFGFVVVQPQSRQKLVIAVQPTLSAAEVLQRAKPIEAF